VNPAIQRRPNGVRVNHARPALRCKLARNGQFSYRARARRKRLQRTAHVFLLLRDGDGGWLSNFYRFGFHCHFQNLHTLCFILLSPSFSLDVQAKGDPIAGFEGDRVANRRRPTLT